MQRSRATDSELRRRTAGTAPPSPGARPARRIFPSFGRPVTGAKIVPRQALRSVAAALLALPLALGAVHPTDAQSPPGTEGDDAAQEILLQATLRPGDDARLELRLIRITLEPNGRSPWHAHPGLEFGVLEAGQLLVEVNGQAIRRGADPDAEGEAVEPATVVKLVAGDRIAYAPGTEMTFRNPGPGATSLLAATILPVGPDAPPGAVYVDGPPTEQDLAGVSSQILGVATLDAARFSESTAAVVLERLAPTGGEAVPAFAGPVLLAVDQGTIVGELVEGSAVVASTGAAATDSGRFEVGPGDAIFFPGGMAATAPLGGEGEAVLLRLGLVPLADDNLAIAAVAEADQSPTPAGSADSADGANDPSPESPPIFAPGTEVVVAVDEARLRAEPSVEGALVAALERGRLLLVVGQPVAADGYDWYPVEDQTDLSTGFVAGELLALEDE